MGEVGTLQTSCPFFAITLPPAHYFRLVSPSYYSVILQAALQAAAHASVDVKNVLDFYRQWKEIG